MIESGMLENVSIFPLMCLVERMQKWKNGKCYLNKFIVIPLKHKEVIENIRQISKFQIKEHFIFTFPLKLGGMVFVDWMENSNNSLFHPPSFLPSQNKWNTTIFHSSHFSLNHTDHKEHLFISLLFCLVGRIKNVKKIEKKNSIKYVW